MNGEAAGPVRLANVGPSRWGRRSTLSGVKAGDGGYSTACLRWGEPLSAPGGRGEQERLWLPVALTVRGSATIPRAAR